MGADATVSPPEGGADRQAGSTLRIQDLTKTFGATRALRDVSMSVRAGAIHGLLGGNGSGKSTLIKILAGVYSGEPGGVVSVGDRSIPVEDMTPDLARELGLRFVHQDPAVFSEMTIAENLALGGSYPRRGAGIKWSSLRARTRELLREYAIDAQPDDLVGSLRQAEQTMLAVARALQDADEHTSGVLVLDEPTASLPPHEVEVLLAALRRLASSGQTILYVSHRIDEVLQLTDSVTILRDGTHVLTRETTGLTEQQLVEHIVGRPIDALFGTVESVADASDTVLEVRDLSGGPLTSVSLRVGAGEIVGVAGLLGSGRTELLRMIFGAYPVETGTIILDGHEVMHTKPADAMRAGIAYVPENRRLDAAFEMLTVEENFTSASLSSYWNGVRLAHSQERGDTCTAITSFAIRTAGPEALMSSLSGGNQQKVILARWLHRNPRVLLLDEPTQGIDVGARADIYAAVRERVKAGMSVVLVTSDLEELAHSCDRALVLRHGRIVQEVSGPDLTADNLTNLVY